MIRKEELAMPRLARVLGWVPRFPYLDRIGCSRIGTASGDLFSFEIEKRSAAPRCVLLVHTGADGWRAWGEPIVFDRSPVARKIWIAAFGPRGTDLRCYDIAPCGGIVSARELRAHFESVPLPVRDEIRIPRPHRHERRYAARMPRVGLRHGTPPGGVRLAPFSTKES